MARKLLYPISPHLSKNQIQLDSDGLSVVKESIKKNYHTGWRSQSNYSKKVYEQDLTDQLIARLENDRRIVIPWLDNARTLQNSHILEIGCGTGSSTVALAEQGAEVTGIDTDEGALLVAEDRCKVYGLDVEFETLNAVACFDRFASNTFDFIIFFACLEHMTIAERITSLTNAWEMLPLGGLLVVLESPNRLWYFDDHTSMLPFFHWLPNELAFRYSIYSPKDNFQKLYLEYNLKNKNHFLRRGRGVSFHEFELSIKPAKDLKVISSLSSFYRFRNMIKQISIKGRLTRQYKSFLMKSCAHIHEGFFEPYLYLIIEKV